MQHSSSSGHRTSRPRLAFGVAAAVGLATLAPALLATGPAGAATFVVDPMDGFELHVAPVSLPARVLPPHPADFAPVNPPPHDLSDSCPGGWVDAGQFKLTAYVLAVEDEFAPEDSVEDPCGLSGTYRSRFLYSTKAHPGGVMMQGSGRTLDGRIVHYVNRGGQHCFEELECPKTASGTCATPGRTVAVDRSVVPMGADLLIEGVGERRAEDTGGGIRGRHIDIYLGDEMTLAAAQSQTRHDRRVCYRDPDA